LRRTHPLNKHRAIFGAALIGVLTLTCHAADVGVLTPAMAGLRVVTYSGESEALTLGLTSLATTDQTDDLNRWASRDHIDLRARLTADLLASLARSGRSAIELAVSRKRMNPLRPIARDEIPASPAAARLLDVTIRYAGLYATSRFAPFRPAFLVEYRWVSPSGDLIQASRLVAYNRDLASAVRSVGFDAAFFPMIEPNARPSIDADPQCKFPTFNSAKKEPERLWTCFDGALAKIAEEIANDVPSSANPSGSMRSERDADPSQH
jgi:hypothetical protein